MEWYNYVACFFAGTFLANAVPHFIHGVSGDKFPTPFAKPPGKGLSSSTTNVLWALFNLSVGYILLVASKMNNDNIWSLVLFFSGVSIMAIMLSITFKSKFKE